MCTSVIPLESRGSLTILADSDSLCGMKNTGMDLDGDREAVCAQNRGDTSVDYRSGCDREAVLHVF